MGKDTPEIRELAANPGLHWQDFEPLARTVLDQLGLFSGDSLKDQALQLMTMWIADWKDCRISYRELAKKGMKLWHRSDRAPELLFWVNLDSDLGMMDSGHSPHFFKSEWDRSNLEGSFRLILQSHWRGLVTTPPAP